MTASVISAQTFNVAGTLTPLLSVTVPSGTTGVYVLCIAWNNIITITTATLNGAASINSFSVSAGGGAYAALAREFVSPSTGAQTLAIVFNETPNEGIVAVIYTQGTVVTGWRDVDGFGDTGPTSATLTTVSTDLVLALDSQASGTAPANESGYTSIATQTSGSTSSRARSIIASGVTTTVTCQGGGGVGLVCLSVADAGGGGVTVNLTGQAGSFSAGSIATSRAVPVAGQAGSFSAGTIASSRDVPITGATGAFSAGTLLPGLSIPLVGQAGAFSAGSITVAVSIALAGQPGTFAAGTITYSAGGDISVSLIGQAGTFSSGTLGVSMSVPLVGTAIAASAGTLSPAFSVTLSGATGAFADGSMGVSRALALQGVIAYFSTGTITPSGGTPTPGSGEVRYAGFIVNTGSLLVR